MASNKVVIRYKFDKKLSKKFYIFHILRNSFFMYFVCAMGLLSTYLLLTTDLNSADMNITYYLSWSISVIGIIFIPLYLFLSSTVATSKEAKQRKNNDEIFEFTKEKIVRADNLSPKKLVLNWYNISKVYDTNEAFYFYAQNDAAFIVPKNAFEEGTIEMLRLFINSYLKKDTKGKIPYIIKDKEYRKLLKEQKKANKK